MSAAGPESVPERADGNVAVILISEFLRRRGASAV